MVTRIPYERETDNIDVKSELENLRQHYANLQHQKELKKGKALKKAMTARPSAAQLRLYREGVHKISTLKLDEEQRKAFDPYAVPVASRNSSPSPVHNRLYEQGMLKKLHQAQEEKRSRPSPLSRKSITSSPICDRLYLEGVAKMKARNSSVPRHERSSSSSSRKSNIRSRSKTRTQTSDGVSIRGSSPNPTCDRLYEQGKAKLRSLAKPKLPPSSVAKPRVRSRSPAIKKSFLQKKQSYDLDDLRTDDAPTGIKLRGRSPAPSQRLSKEDDDFSYDDESPRVSQD